MRVRVGYLWESTVAYTVCQALKFDATIKIIVDE